MTLLDETSIQTLPGELEFVRANVELLGLVGQVDTHRGFLTLHVGKGGRTHLELGHAIRPVRRF